MRTTAIKLPTRLMTQLSGVILTLTVMILTTNPAEARGYTKLSDVLGAHGFDTLKFALDTTGLTDTLDQNRVTLFAPTNDVFADTAEALGCDDAVALATALLGIHLGDGTDALTAILTLHAVPGKLGVRKLLLKKEVRTFNGAAIKTGVNDKGVYAQGEGNVDAKGDPAPVNITNDDIWGYKFRVYPINGILLPFAPEGPVC